MVRFRGNWDEWRRRFVSGTDDVTLKWLSEQPGAPAYGSLRKRAAPNWENWEQQRRNYREQMDRLVAVHPDVRQTTQKIERIIDAAEMLTRHAGLAKLAGAITIHELKEIRSKQVNGIPVNLRLSEIVAIAKFAIETERLIEGLATSRIDLASLSDDELERIIKDG